MRTLYSLLAEAQAAFPDRPAVVDPGGPPVSYRELDRLAEQASTHLERIGLKPGHRVGIMAHKSVHTVGAIFGILRAGGAYVPVDPTAPLARIAYIFGDCAVSAIVTEQRFVEPLQAAFPDAHLRVLAPLDGGLVLIDGPAGVQAPASENSLAYILYTSGSTGKPKGVMISHNVALSFVDWGSEVFQPEPADIFSNHSPFHFDLSIFDLYVSIKHGASVVLIGDELGKQPIGLVDLIAHHRITIWYSTPSILRLLLEFGKMERFPYPALRKVLFAGEVFPVKHLRELKRIWPTQRFFNLYGPTETNVCTYLEIPPAIPEEQTEPFPIGAACSHCQTAVMDSDGKPVPPGGEGELWVAGGPVMLGYWNLPEQNQRAFYWDPEGTKWYRTGDVVVEEGGIYLFRGRRDRMVKRRSYRVELGEIESALYKHPRVSEAAVIATPDEESGVLITAFLTCNGDGRPSLIELKRFSAENLPKYMIPDRFSIQPQLPKTSTDKIDYQRLKQLV